MPQPQKCVEDLFKFFRMFGFVPFAFSRSGTKVTAKLSRSLVPAVAAFVVSYWFCLGLNFLKNAQSSDRLALISNWIQLTINAFMLTTILASPTVAADAANEIFELFGRIDGRLANFGICAGFAGENCRVLLKVAGLLALLLYVVCYEVYVVLFRHRLCTVFYWLLTILPTVVLATALCFAYSLLSLFLRRLRLARKLLENESRGSSDFFQIVKVIESKAVEQSVRTTMPTIFFLYSEIIDLSRAIEKLLGPIFLASFTSIFVVTTTQIYHTYTIVMSGKHENLGYTAWSAILCINTVLLNAVLTVLLTTICEAIAGQSHECMRSIMKMRLNGSRYLPPEDIQKMTSAFQFLKGEISFSAVGFFKVNYKMFCGMISSILTYLIIYIQFYSLYADNTKQFHNKNRLLIEAR